ncbi:hypothetical protein CYMTET_32005 [Cymbomonas tetramitiformis]|uniref:Uncharacterized protein n=1 Tax=Cymbomonas tetramitiformis TaxID=36881 RepID=A0AAE0FG99_9CHLO|nr:hypothetical protein CYMTET_32005 [Cymbomonas tetramitiformis]
MARSMSCQMDYSLGGMEKKTKRRKKVAGDVTGRREKEWKAVRDAGRLRHETMTPDISEQKPGQAEGRSRPAAMPQSMAPSEGGTERPGNEGGQQPSHPSRSSERSSEQEVREDGDATEDSDSEEEYLHSCWGEGTADEVKGSQAPLAPAWSPQEPTSQGSDEAVDDDPMSHRGVAQPIQAEAMEEDSDEAAPGEEEAMEEEGAMSSWADTVEQHLAVLANDTGANGYLGENDGIMAELPYASSDAMLLPELDIEAPLGGGVAALKAGWDEPEEGGKSSQAAKACMVQASASMVPVAACAGGAGAPDGNVVVANPSIPKAPSNAKDADQWERLHTVALACE